MNEVRLPSDFDWVTARAKCSIAKFYERLYAGAQVNVQKRKDLRLELFDQGPIDLNATVPGIFSVMRGVSPGKHVAVRFQLDGQRILVEGNGVKVDFQGTVTLNDAGECRLRVGNQDLDEWQVLRRALEELFFGF